MVTLAVDDKEIKTKEGNTVLQACLDNDVYIPNLCYLKEMKNPPASCRLCFVEIEGYKSPVTSCTVNVQDGMVVRTDTEHVKRLQKTAFELLLSVHHVDCKNCPANRRCELQRISKHLHFGLKLKRLDQIEREIKIDQEHPFLEYHPHRCVLCGRCIFVCKEKNGYPILSFAKRGLDTVVTFFGEGDSASVCRDCQDCIDVCPVAALTPKTGNNNPLLLR